MSPLNTNSVCLEKEDLKVAYLVVYDGNPESGVTKKVISQKKSFNRVGLKTDIIFFSREPISIKDENIKYVNAPTPPYLNYKERYALLKTIAKTISMCLKKYDIVYCRDVFPSLSLLLKIMGRNGKIIYEMQTFLVKEAIVSRSWGYFLLCFCLLPLLLKNIDGIVGVTNEITDYYSKNRKLKKIVIGNGIIVSSVPVKNKNIFDKNELHLICLARFAKWHGVDRLISGIAEYRGNKRIYLHIVGDGSEYSSLVEMAKEKRIEDKVVFHGFKTGKELDSIFDSCQIAVGSLGCHRKGLNETSELKVREYCARGIPFISSSSDPDFPENFPFKYKVESNDSPINIEEISIFAENVLSDPFSNMKMRQYAEANLDWSIKSKRLKSFFETVVNKGDVLTPSRTAHDIVQERGEGKDDGAGTKRHQSGRETLDCQKKGRP